MFLVIVTDSNHLNKNDPYAALKMVQFRKFILGKLCFTIALQIQGVIVSWQIFDITKNPLSLGFIGLTEAIPFISVALFAGHVVDNNDRKVILLRALTILLACSSGLFFLVLNLEDLSTFFVTSSLYLTIFISGIARGFLGPSQFALMSQTVEDRSHFGNAVSWNSTVWQSSQVLGPALGGMIFSYFGAINSQHGYIAAYGLDLVFMAISIFLFIGIKPIPIVRTNTASLGIFASLKEGLQFVFKKQEILGALSLDMFAVLFGGAIALLPVYCKDILHVGAHGLGLLRAAPALGSIMVMFLIAYRPIKKNAGKIMLFSVAGFGLSILLFGLSTAFWLSFAFLAMSGMFDAVSVVIRQTLIQTLTPEQMKGRVSSVNSVFVGSSNEIGSFESGLAATLLGTVNAVVFGSFMTFGVVIITFFKSKKLRQLDLP